MELYPKSKEIEKDLVPYTTQQKEDVETTHMGSGGGLLGGDSLRHLDRCTMWLSEASRALSNAFEELENILKEKK